MESQPKSSANQEAPASTETLNAGTATESTAALNGAVDTYSPPVKFDGW